MSIPGLLAGSSISQGQVTLRAVDLEGARRLASIAGGEIHGADYMPFGAPWSDAPASQRTPIVAALIAGGLTENIEVETVSLHDSMHLIPHQLLGGTILDLGSNCPLDYLALYERETVDLDPKAKPVPPYRAVAGLPRRS